MSGMISITLEKIIEHREIIKIYINKKNELTYTKAASKLVDRKNSLYAKEEDDRIEVRELINSTVDPAEI